MVLILLILSATFSCLETAMTACSKARVYRFVKDLKKRNIQRRAILLIKLLANREKVIGTFLLVNNFVNICASTLVAVTLAKMFGDSGAYIATILMTIIILVFSEILPKKLAIRNPEIVAIYFSYFTNFLVKIFYPVINLISSIVNFIIKFFFRPKKILKFSNLDDIRDAIFLKHKEGYLFKKDKEMIEGILDLSELEVEEIMTHRKDIKSINIDIGIKNIVKEMLKIKHSFIPLWKDNKENIVAILDVKKLLKKLQIFKENEELKEINLKLKDFTFEPLFVPNTNSLTSQLLIFKQQDRKIAVVVDEYGVFCGVVSLSDILNIIIFDLDEGDKYYKKIRKISDSGYIVNGKILIRDLIKILNIDMEESDNAYNLSAFLIEKFKKVPNRGEKININEKLIIEILKVDDNKINLTKFTLL